MVNEPTPDWDAQTRNWAEIKAKYPALFAPPHEKPRPLSSLSYADAAERDERHVAARETALRRPLSAPSQASFKF